MSGFQSEAKKAKTCNPCLGQPRDSVHLPSFLFFLVGGIPIVLLGDDDSRRCHVSFVCFLLGSASIYPPLDEWPTHIAFPRNVFYQVWVEVS